MVTCRRAVPLATLAALLLSVPAPAEGQALGLIPASKTELRHFPRFVARERTRDLPSTVDHTDPSLPVGDQGGLNSCVSWAVGYYYKAYQEKREHGWSLASRDYQFSPSFLYNQCNDGKDEGSSLAGNFDVLNQQGCAPWSVMPYTDYHTFPNQRQCEAAMPYRGESASYIFPEGGSGEDALAAMKAVLSDGDLLVIGVTVYTDNLSPTGGNDVHDGPRGGELRGQHALAVVGYDDNRAYTDENGIPCHGAFKVVNSWGNTWSGDGYTWLSYRFVEVEAVEAWTMVDRVAYEPAAWARIDISHESRGQLIVAVGAGADAGNPLFREFVYWYDGGAYPDIHTSVDLTDGAEYLPPTSTTPWHVVAMDPMSGKTGTLTGFSIVFPDGTKCISPDPPVVIPDGGGSARAFIYGGTALHVLPPGPGTDDDLLADVTGGAAGCSYAWYKDGVLQPDLTTDAVSHERTRKGETWKCVVTPLSGPPAEAEVTIGNTPSFVEWVGEAGYVGDGVDPDSGDPADGPSPTTFVFRARYADADGDAPTKAKCILRVKECGAPWRQYVVLPMALESGEITTGATYSCSARLPNEVLRYRFLFADADGLSAGVPSTYHGGPFVGGPPYLSWTGATGFAADGIEPDNGSVGTRFRFQVLYADSAGDAPATHELLIRRNGKLCRQKSLVPAPAGSYRLGKLYRTSVVLRLPGTYEYCFRFADADGSALGPPSLWQSGPTIANGTATLAVTSLMAVPCPAGAEVAFTLSGPASVTATVTNIAGRPVRTIVRNKPLGAGVQTLVWDRRAENRLPVPLGMYLIRVRARDPGGRQAHALTTVMTR